MKIPTTYKETVEQVFEREAPRFVEHLIREAMMTDLNSEQLNGKYKQAYEFAMNDHLQAKQDLDAAKQEIEELRFKLTEQQVKIDAMDAFNKLLEDRLNMAMIDRTRAIDEHALDRALLDVILAAIEKRKKDATA